MTLPTVRLRTGSVTIAGTDVPIRALSRLEVLRVAEMDNVEAEPYILSCAAGVPLEEATTWLQSVDADTGNIVGQAILRLSATMDPPAGSTGEGPTAKP